MKGLQEILDEVKKKLPKDASVYVSNDPHWKMYCGLTGFIGKDYFSLYFRECQNGVAYIEICQTTDNPKYFIKLIRKIDKIIEINYTEVTTTYKERTA